MSSEPQSSAEPPLVESHRQEIEQLCDNGFGVGVVSVGQLEDINRGRGAFSVVIRASLSSRSVPAAPRSAASEVPTIGSIPRSVVAKLPIPGPNGEAAIAGGAYAREALAYRTIVADSPTRTPIAYAVETPDDGTCSLLLEDLSGFRSADQLVGLDRQDALSVASTLSRLHRAWTGNARLAELPVRRNTVSGISAGALDAGLTTLTSTWADQLSDCQRSTFERLVSARSGLVDRFCAEKPTLCHGDPRADNLVFDDGVFDDGVFDDGVFDDGASDDENVVLFDWQQLAIQFGEADLAWLAATSLEVEDRRAIDRELVSAYGGDLDRYRLGFALPGMAVLMLAQRSFHTERARRFVSVSLQRIAAAVEDLEVAALG